MADTLLLAGRLLVLSAAGLAYLCLLGVALEPWLLPPAWRPYRPVAAPFLGWAVLVALAYPLNAALPGRPVLIALGSAAAIACVARLVRRGHGAWPPVERSAWIAAAVGVLALASPVSLYAGAGALSALVADSDVEHFADVVAALLAFPIGWSPAAQVGLEATPVGLAYHYVHAAISAVTGHHTFGTAVPSHLVMVALAPTVV